MTHSYKCIYIPCTLIFLLSYVVTSLDHIIEANDNITRADNSFNYNVPYSEFNFSTKIDVNSFNGLLSIHMNMYFLCDIDKVSVKLQPLDDDINTCPNSSADIYLQNDDNNAEYRLIELGSNRTNGNNNSCFKTEELKFYCVLKGCYKLYLEVSKTVSKPIQLLSNPVYIDTYVRDEMFNNLLDIQENYNEKLNLIIDTHMNDTLLKILTMDNKIWGKFNVSLLTDIYNIAVTDKCEEDIYLDDYNETEPDAIYENETSIKAVFSNVSTDGYRYCLRFELLTAATNCKHRKYWTYTVKSLPEKIDLDPASTGQHLNRTILFTTIIISIAIVITIIISCYGIKRRRMKNQYSYKPCDKKYMKKFSRSGSLSNSQEVLLVYARDCSQFMETVKHFTILLENYACTVYDFFSERFAEEVSLNPQDWVFKKISSSDVKVILLLNPCAVYLKEAENPHLLYTMSHCFDNLFPYAVDLLMKKPQCIFREKLFIVSFDSSRTSSTADDKYQLFNCITADTRYVLPKHLTHLIANLKNVELDCIESHGHFGKMCECLNYFYEEEPLYLCKLLNKM